MPSIRKRRKLARMKFHEIIKQEFDYDVDELEDYVDEQSPDIMADLVNAGSLKSRISTMDNVKGSKKIKLKSSKPSLQAAENCGWTPEGGIILTDREIKTARVKIQEEYCNEDLNDTWAQIENAAGANRQDTVPPNFADTMIMYYMDRATELDEDLIMNGDTDSSDDNLNHYDGFKKRWDADGDLNVYYSTETEITAANAYSIARGLWGAVPTIIKRHRISHGVEMICGYETAQAILDNNWDDKDFNGKIETTEENGELSFVLPATNVTVRSIVTLDGTDCMYVVPYSYMFYGTDLADDMDGFQFVYNENDEKLRFGVKWRSGIEYVFPQYFTRLRLTPAS